MLGASFVFQVAATLSAEGVVAGTHVNPVPGGASLSEVRIVQPNVMLHARALGDRLTLHSTLNLEGLTIPGGVLTIGAWGEGFVDRRHPHTYAHEIMLSGQDLLGRLDGSANVSFSVGKGFVPFGSDDPMSRPVLAYPVNHHWSQLLERAVGIAGVRAGPMLLEGALFNGDEPEHPSQWPLVAERFGDSWSARVTAFPAAWLELAGSRAAVKSPEHRPGGGAVEYKWHVSARAEQTVGLGQGYGLVEWARNTEAGGSFRFHSVLGEAAWALGGSRGYYRFERTDRPEEERLLDQFRTVRPHLEGTILGTTRWTVHTVGARVQLGFVPVPIRVSMLLEGSHGRATNVTAGLFEPRDIYGKNTFWSLTLALGISTGPEHRMGRYGAAAPIAHEHEP